MLLRCKSPSKVSSHILIPAGIRPNYAVFCFSTVSLLSLRMKPEYGGLKSVTCYGPGHTPGWWKEQCPTENIAALTTQFPHIYKVPCDIWLDFHQEEQMITTDLMQFVSMLVSYYCIILPPPFLSYTAACVCACVVWSAVDRPKSTVVVPSQYSKSMI